MSVYIINPREGLDYAHAKAFGDVKPVLVNIGPMQMAEIKAVAEDLAKAFDAENDYILPISGNTAVVFTAYFVAATTSDRMKILIWNQTAGCYQSRVMTLGTPTVWEGE